jgi:hemoglobin/transferrin/lactoferrin receptor protein
VLTPVALAALIASAQAQTAPQTPQAPKITVSATRIESAEDTVPATVTSKTAQEIERALARDLKTLLEDEPGVSVRLQPARMSAVFGPTGRGGNEGINIRGLEGNQVLLQTDGVRLPMAYDSGPYVAGRGDYIDVEAYKRVELLRGPSSTSYGSDGLSGAVSFVTKDPADLLTLGKDWQGSLKLGYSSADKAWLAVPSFAVKSGGLQAMVLASVRRGHELKNMGSDESLTWNRTAPNPQDRRSDYLLGKLLLDVAPGHQLKASLEQIDRDITTSPIYTVVGMPFVNANIIDADASEHVNRRLGKLEYQYNNSRNPWLQRLNAYVFDQEATNRQLGTERYRSPPASWARRDRDTLYGEDSQGLGVQAESNFGGAAVAHRLLWGVDASDTRVYSLKDGAHYTAAGALITGSLAFVPNQSFPDTDYRLLGAFVQDEISVGPLTITPALRFDRFELDPQVGNPLYTVNNKVAPSKLSGDELSPRLGLTWKLAPQALLYAQYGHGFRAPTPGQVNGGVSNPTANPPYRSIGNPDLKPETSDSVEVGARGQLGPVKLGLAVFKSRYRNFIDANIDVTATTTVPLDPGMAANTRTFQSINLRRAEISGVELSAGWAFAAHWLAEARYAHARGNAISEGARAPLASIEPDKVTLKLAHERKGLWGAELTVVAQERQKRPYADGLYIPAGYVAADLSAWWDISKQWQLLAAVHNIGDRKVVLWSDVRGTASTSTLTDAYTQPGRNFSASLRYNF